MAARDDVAAAIRDSIAAAGSLYSWARNRPERTVFHGRGEAYAVRLGSVDAVVRHARRGGVPAFFSEDLFTGTPRFFRELDLSLLLSSAGVATPAVLAGVAYHAVLGYRADVATARVAGSDLASLCFGDRPPEGARRTELFRAVGRLVRRVHDAGFVHPDLQLRNLVVNDAAPPPEAWLLDVDTCRSIHPRDEAARRRNLDRFYRSWEKWNTAHGPRLTPDDRSAFEDAYAEEAKA